MKIHWAPPLKPEKEDEIDVKFQIYLTGSQPCFYPPFVYVYEYLFQNYYIT